MNYHNITKDDMLNGEGLRVVLWVAGCSHNCKNCQNPITHDPNGGIPFDETAEKELFNELSKPYIDGITFSGGDPLYITNREKITELAKKVKQLGKTVWLYTGYTYNEVKVLPMMNYIDVIVDGEYIDSLRDEKLEWVGSSNQQIVHLN